MSTTPTSKSSAELLDAYREIGIRQDLQRDEAEQLADQKAHIVADLVAAERLAGADRPKDNPRKRAADLLGVALGTVDKALARAKDRPRPSFLPGNLLERLFDLEAAEIPPLTASNWQAIAHLVSGTIIDFTWLHSPGEMLAAELEDAAGEYGDLAGWDTAPLAAAVRSWRRTQVLAVLEAIRQGAVDSLPTLPDDEDDAPVPGGADGA
ncbi:hypothetical protein [Kitasatospora cineracea]|uniref:Uncharacterized protein n=1 Tax=Kitasatospora cineracea TaxID=88074 RepID=A0A3N4R9H7_9ACTN|nr:hypothetical protein [Kitasatospora cineracea]RPE27261.1 hypothetical protein EDD38_7406 [Kitasatospora cineracea]